MFDLDGLECLTALMFLALWVFVQRRNTRFVPGSVWPIGVLAIALIPAISATTQFTTNDESAFLDAIAGDSDFLQVNVGRGSFHVSAAVFLPLAKLLREVGTDVTFIRQICKALHWLIGAGVLAGIARVSRRIVSPRSSLFEPILLAFLLLLPVDQLALKVFNYDCISLFGAMLAILLLALAWRENRQSLAWWSVVFASMAAAEKLNASPYLILSILGQTLLGARSAPSNRWRVGIRACAGALMLSCSTSLLLIALYAATTRLPVHLSFWLSAVDPLVSWAFVPLQFLFGLENPVTRRLEILALTISMLLGSATMLIQFSNAPASAAWYSRRAAMIGHAPFLLPVLLVLGAFGAFNVSPYWAPYKPSLLTRDLVAMNGAALHFGESSWLAHNLDYALFCCTEIAISIPSIFWLAALLVVLRRPRDWQLPFVFAGLVTIGIVMATVAVLTHAPLNIRYLSVTSFSITLYLGCVILRGLSEETDVHSRWQNSAFALCVLILMLLEIAPFAPVYAAFRPFWVEYPDARPALGVLNASWVGWGEEAMEGGKKIKSACEAHSDHELSGVPCAKLRLHLTYSGEWLGAGALQVDNDYRNPGFCSTADYFIFNRTSIIQGWVALPTIAPDFVVSARGYPMAWIYRGDRLGEDGYCKR